MSAETAPTTVEQQRTIDAPPADIFALLSEPSHLPEYWPAMTVTETDTPTEVAYSVAPDGLDGSITLSTKVDVTDPNGCTALTMTFDGTLAGTVEWTLKPNDNSTLVTAMASLTLDPATFQDAIEGMDCHGIEFRAVVEATLPSTFEAALTTLKERCEQPSPPASMVSGEIPDISCPVPADIHPDFEQVTAYTVEWAHDLDLIERESPSPRLLADPSFASFTHPTASYPGLCVYSDWSGWGFLYDDMSDSLDPDRMDRFQQSLLAALERGTADDHQEPLVRSLADITQRGKELGSSAWYERFVQHHREYFKANQWEARNRRTHVPTRADYIENRRVASGGYIVTDFIALAGEINRTSAWYHSETYQDLLGVVSNIASWTNDVYSLRRELSNGDVNNFVVVVRAEQDCSLQDAVTEVCETIGAEVRRYEELCQQLTEEFNDYDDLEDHLSDLGGLIAGNLAWSKETARYGFAE